jgi:hypothetical protein
MWKQTEIIHTGAPLEPQPYTIWNSFGVIEIHVGHILTTSITRSVNCKQNR